MTKHLLTLELDRIIAAVKEKTVLEHDYSVETVELLNDRAAVERALAEVDEAVILRQRMHRFPLYFESDILFILNMVHKNRTLSVEELIEIGKFLDTIKANRAYLDSLESAQIPVTYYREYVSELFYPKDLNNRIKEILTPYGEISDDASDALRSIRRAIKDAEKNIQLKLQEFINKNSAKLTQPLVSMRNDRYVVPVKIEFKNAVPGIVHDLSSSGETAFIEPLAVANLNNRLNELLEDEKREIYNILITTSREVDAYYAELTTSFNILKQLDLVFAKAEYALEIGACRPRVNDQGIFSLINARHPLLDMETVVPNTVTFGKYRGILITGPNTGGKTVLLKTVGLLALMVKAGLLVPCAPESDIMIFDNVFADIGDEQSIDQSLSTFSGHLKNIIDIIDNVTENSLVLLDELGSGTDPAEGTALAIAIFDFLLAKKCMIIATSHYSELKIHAYNSENIINASVEFDLKTLKPTYKLLMGVPGQSNALKIARLLGLNEAILNAAERNAYRRDAKTETALAKLIDQSRELDRQLKSADEKERILREKLAEIDALRAETDYQKSRILREAEEEAKNIVAATRTKINQLIDDLDRLKKQGVKTHEIAEMKHRYRKIREAAETESEVTADYVYKPNMSVYLENFKAYGIIIKENKNNKYDVQLGNATVTVDKKYLRPAENPKPSFPRQIPKVATTVKKHVAMSLDLRGLRYEEARDKLEKYLDAAYLAGLREAHIIHGYGTGVIREMVRNYLKNAPEVESHRFGGEREGGRGVTVITLKQK
ncbi:MAG TPA: endonuclease MutS2 [Bacilli bacterium]|nr:endonuclease MutS2 [Bacilli bacterium]HQC89303.1 endonuclease MutS2 [Bacilli bacterium]